MSLSFLISQNILVHLRAVGKLALHAEATNKTRQQTSNRTEYRATPVNNVFLL